MDPSENVWKTLFFSLVCTYIRDHLKKDSSSSHTAAGTGWPTARSRLLAELNRISIKVTLKNWMSVQQVIQCSQCSILKAENVVSSISQLIFVVIY